MQAKNYILIVDDVMINRKILVNLLKKKHKTLEAENGREAFHILLEKGNQVMMVLLDLSMPVMDGYTFLSKIRRNPKLCEIPVIVITSEDTKEDEIRALKLGARDFIPKPYQVQIIEQRIQNIRTVILKEQKLRKELTHDALTGLYNRTGFEEIVEKRLVNVTEEAVFLLLDIKQLKGINKCKGFSYGDTMIQKTAEFLRGLKLEKKVIGRIGDDEFGILLRQSGGKAEKTAWKNIIGIEWEKFWRKENNSEISCTVGMAAFPKQGKTFLELYQNAEEADKILLK